MKFLNLETGHTFDGIWKHVSGYTDWTVQTRNLPKYCDSCDAISNVSDLELTKLRNNPNYELLYTDTPTVADPGKEIPAAWTPEFNFDTSCKYAYRMKVPQSKGYIFWFPHEQSIGITYTMPICIITDTSEPLNLKMEDNDVFSFIKASGDEVTVDGYKFGKPVYSKTWTTEPQQIGNQWAHIVSVSCLGQTAGEFVCKVDIDENSYIRIGADLYGEYEPAYINLSNMGVELPETIQKAIYDVDPHEDVKDNIIINRKFKELLTNYWDIVANKGSYKSLLNSLEWFEWGDTLKVKEIWKRRIAGLTMFDDRAVMSMFENKLKDSFHNFVKTTYVSIYYSLQDESGDIYDDELNPQLTAAVLKWSKEDIQLKMALLSQFFSIYFMPIHMALLHATAEDQVFTTTIKAIHAGEVKRDDCFGDFDAVACNIKDGTIFKLGNATACVTDDTVYAIRDHITHGTDAMFGVDPFPTDGTLKDSLIAFSEQYYAGPGTIIPIELNIPVQTYGDFIKYTNVTYTDKQGNVKRVFFNDVFKSTISREETESKPVKPKSNVNIKFNFLAKASQDYVLNMAFITGSSKTITKTIKFTVEDADNLNINIYKIKAKDNTYKFDIDDFKDTTVAKYLFRIQDGTIAKPYYTQYLPYMLPNNPKYNEYTGIKLNRTVIFDVRNNSLGEIRRIRYCMQDTFLEFAKYNEAGDTTYLIYVSKRFYGELPTSLNTYMWFCNIVRNELGFYPQFHMLEKIDGNSIEDYTINQYDAICCAAEINNGETSHEFKYGKQLDRVEWYFINSTTSEYIPHPSSSKQPFIARTDNNLLDPGYYGISFCFSLTDGSIHECRLDSAFRIKPL